VETQRRPQVHNCKSSSLVTGFLFVLMIPTLHQNQGKKKILSSPPGCFVYEWTWKIPIPKSASMPTITDKLTSFRVQAKHHLAHGPFSVNVTSAMSPHESPLDPGVSSWPGPHALSSSSVYTSPEAQDSVELRRCEDPLLGHAPCIWDLWMPCPDVPILLPSLCAFFPVPLFYPGQGGLCC
jgi:hypothetical protein